VRVECVAGEEEEERSLKGKDGVQHVLSRLYTIFNIYIYRERERGRRLHNTYNIYMLSRLYSILSRLYNIYMLSRLAYSAASPSISTNSYTILGLGHRVYCLLELVRT